MRKTNSLPLIRDFPLGGGTVEPVLSSPPPRRGRARVGVVVGILACGLAMSGPAVAGDEEGAYRLTKSLHVTAPLPVTAVGGRIGVSALGDRIELDAESTLFWIPPGNAAFGLSLGSRFQFAPIPGRWGRRFTLAGSIFRAFAHGRPSFDSLGGGVGFGYRHPIERPSCRPRWLFLELGAERDFLYTYSDVLITPRLTAGFGF